MGWVLDILEEFVYFFIVVVERGIEVELVGVGGGVEFEYRSFLTRVF